MQLLFVIPQESEVSYGMTKQKKRSARAKAFADLFFLGSVLPQNWQTTHSNDFKLYIYYKILIKSLKIEYNF